MYFLLFVTLCFIFVPIEINALDQCNINSIECHPGQCVWKLTGNRCQCPRGLMGYGCKRPCQNVYKSCERWKREGRCEIKLSTFFHENCALTCQICVSDGTKLIHALPVALEPLAWLVGKWKAQVRSRYRFPILEQIPFNYTEIMDIQPSEPNMFDRPSLNYRSMFVVDEAVSRKCIPFYGHRFHSKCNHGIRPILAVSMDSPLDVHSQLGYVALNAPVQSSIGKQTRAPIQVAIAMSSNTGLNTIEEGVLNGETINFVTTHKVAMEGKHFVQVKRRLALAGPQLLHEQLIFVDAKGTKRQLTKQFHRVHDYLKAVKMES